MKDNYTVVKQVTEKTMDELDLSEMMVQLSDAIAEKDVDILRVLYRDFGFANTDLEKAKSGFDLFQLLIGPGILKSTDISILVETIQLTGLNHLKAIIKNHVPYPDVDIKRFSEYRQKVLSLGKRMSVEEIQKCCHIHGGKFKSQWKLIQHLENTNVITEETIESFLESLKPNQRNEDFNKLLSDMSDTIRRKGKHYVDMLRMLYPEYVNSQADLWKAKSAFDVFKLLQEAGHLKPNDISILCETIKLTGLEGELKEIIERYAPYDAEVEIRFSQYRQEVINIGKRFSAKILRRACRLYYSTDVPYGSNGWKILKYLQDIDVISEDKISLFHDKLNTINDDVSVPPEKLRRNQDNSTRTYLQSWLRKMYQHINIITPAFWNDSSNLDIKDVFTDLSLLQLGGGEGAKSRLKIKQKEGRPTSLSEVLGIVKSTESCNVLITGKGGMGKTTLLTYIAHNWATGMDDTFGDKLLFLINIRDIQPGKTMLDAIIQEINPKRFSQIFYIYEDPVKLLETYIRDHDNEIILLLDGLDELGQGVTSPLSLFKNLELSQCRVILTSRPGKTAKFDTFCDAHVQVNGFNPWSIRNYISKYFNSRNETEMGNELIRKFNLHSACTYSWGGDSKEAFDLCSSPFLLLKICTIWEQKQQLPKDLSDLFKELICCILNQYINRSGTKCTFSEFSRIPENYKCAILGLGKCMYNNLKNENRLTIDKFELSKILPKNLIQLALEPGFVYKDKQAEKDLDPELAYNDKRDTQDDLKEIYTPPHKLISEAIAGFYLSEELDSLDPDEYEILRSNEHLHMTRVFTIEFLGVNASKLLKPWLINKASNFNSLAQYIRYVKKEYQDVVLKDLDEGTSLEMQAQCQEMCETYRKVLCMDDDDTKSGDEYLLQLMGRCYDEYEDKPNNLVKKMISMIKESPELSIESICTRIVHILIVLDGLYGDHASIHKSYFEYLAQWKDNEIDILTTEMKKLEFSYSSMIFNFSKPIASKQTKLSTTFITHLMKTSRSLTFVTLSCVTSDVLNTVFSFLSKNDQHINLEYLSLEGNDLSEFNGVSLVNLFKIAHKLKELDMTRCNLSSSILASVVKECEDRHFVLHLSRLIISHNRFEDNDGASFANFVKFAPKLKYLDIRHCCLKTRFFSNFCDECDSIGVLLSDHMLRLDGNTFRDISGALLAELVRLSGHSFKWTDYDLSADNLKGLISYARGLTSRLVLPWKKLDLSGVDLATADAETLACLLDISPNLNNLGMNACNLSGSKLNEVLDECEMIGVVLKDNMLSLKANNLSDIDHSSLSTLVNLIGVSDNSREGRRRRIYKQAIEPDAIFKWNDYSFTSNNLQGLIDYVNNDDSSFDTFVWTTLDLSGFDLSLLKKGTLAYLLKLSPQLVYLKMSKCNLSGSHIKSFFDECGKRNVTLKGKIMLSLKDNNLSDIDDESLFTIVGLSEKSFKWKDYCLSAGKLQDLIMVCLCDVGNNLAWENLNLSNTNMDELTATTLFGLFKISPKLEVLNMSSCHLQSKVFDDVVEKCIRNNVVLKFTNLVLSGNNFKNIKAETVSIFPRCMPCLEKLDLSNCQIHCNVIENLPSSVLGGNEMKSLTSINLSGNDFNSLNRAMITTFSRFFPMLKHLGISNCNLPVKTMQQLSKMGSKTNVTVELTSLYLEENNLSFINWPLFAAHMSSTSSLKILKLDGCHLTCNFLHSIARVLSRNEIKLRLTDVFLNNNDLSNLNAASLILLLTSLPSLMRIYMDSCNLSSGDMYALVQAMSYVGSKELLRVFNTLRLSNNNFSDIDGGLLASLFSAVNSLCSPSLTSFIPQLVVLSSCQLNDSILMNMADSWKVPIKGFRLMIDNNNIADKSLIKKKLGTIIAELLDF